MLQIMPAVGQVKALIAERKVGNLLISQRKGQAEPVVKRRIDNFICGKTSLVVGQRHMTDLTAPAFNQRYGQALRRQCGKGSFATDPRADSGAVRE